MEAAADMCRACSEGNLTETGHVVELEREVCNKKKNCTTTYQDRKEDKRGPNSHEKAHTTVIQSVVGHSFREGKRSTGERVCSDWKDAGPDNVGAEGEAGLRKPSNSKPVEKRGDTRQGQIEQGRESRGLQP